MPQQSPWDPNANHNYKSNSSNGFPGLQKPLAGSNKPIGSEYKARQQDEVEALRSIFMEDFQDVNKDTASAWSKNADHSFRLRLTAFSATDMAVTLSVTLTATYPNSAPLLSVQGLDKIREKYQKRINEVIEKLPKSLLGSEMIFDIASPIRDILEDAAQAGADDAILPSLGEERALREAEDLKLQKAKEDELEKKRQEEDLEEQQMLDAMLQEEVNRQKSKFKESKRRNRLSTGGEATLAAFRNDGMQRLTFDQPVEVQIQEGAIASFQTVSVMTKLRSGPVTNVSLVRPDTSADKSDSLVLVVKQVKFDCQGPKQSSLRNRILTLEQELEALKVLRKTSNYANVIHVLDFRVDRSAFGHGGESWNLSVLTDYGDKGSLGELLDIAGSLSADNVRAYTIQILESLEFYHCNGIVHGAIRLDNVILCRPTSGSTIVKLADGGFQHHLHEIKDAIHDVSDSTEARSAYWAPPEQAQTTTHILTRKTDVWDFGVVFLQMVLGRPVMENFSSPSACFDAIDFSPLSKDFALKLFKSDSKKRPGAFDLLANAFLRSNAPVIDQGSTGLDSKLSSSGNLMPPKTPHARHDSSGALPSFSRYTNDFDELARLGKGGFGEVFKARNKLDGQLYAIKKITQKSSAALSDVLSEIMLLSRLNHPYVVRYFNAWPEEDVVASADLEEDPLSFTESSSISPDAGPSIEFGHSTGGLDIISSTGGPQVEFGYCSDDETESESDDERSASTPADGYNEGESLKLKRTSSSTKAQRVVRSTLYIQMEYCERHTLRDLIRRGLWDDTEEQWRLFRQVLEGLSHIHGHGIIHRDLKPANVFIDVAGHPRIGDFGLATSGQYYLADKAGTSTGTVDSDMTRSIGTAMYVAPELRSNVNGHYNEKVDMYSLGIIFFEMCFALTTEMERGRILSGLREKDFTLPSAFQDAEKAIQGEIIKSLLSHRPAERPSSLEILKGGKLPVQIEDQTIRQALQNLSDLDSPYYQKIMSALFSQPIKQVKDYAWDMGSTNAYNSIDLVLQGMIKETLSAIFRRHGAVENTRPLLIPRSQYYSTNVVQLLDSSGTLVQLPYDLTLPYARLIAKQPPEANKSFSFGSVYRDLYTGGQPRSHSEVDFDIVSNDALDLALKEAEVIKVVDEIIDAFPSLRTRPMCYHINHSDLLDLILDFCRIPKPQRPTVNDCMSKLNIGQWTWQKIRLELRSPSLGIPSTSLDDLSQFNFRDEPENVVEKLTAIFEKTGHHEKSLPIFAHLRDLHMYLKRFGIQRKIYLNPLSSFNDKFYHGAFLFQCLYDTKKRDVFAAGGRYDQLVRDHRPKTQGHYGNCHAVGFNLGWEKLFTSMSRFQKAGTKGVLKKAEVESKSQWLPRKCDVLVASFDNKVLRTVGLDLVTRLWAADISAEVSTDLRSVDELMAHYREENHGWLVMIKQDSSGVYGDRVVKVRNVARKEDSDIRYGEIVSWLRNEIQARNSHVGHTAARPRLHHQTSGTHSHEYVTQSGASTTGPPASLTGLGESNESDVRVLFSMYKGKKNNRRSVVEAAHSRTHELVLSMLEGPIAAIEVKDDVLDAIRDTSLTDPDSWRKVIHGVPLGERKYLSQVHELMSDLAQDTRNETRNAFIYNFRTGSCIYYDLGRSKNAVT